MKKVLFSLLFTFAVAVCSARRPAVVIIQVADPQMGFYHDNRDMDYEISTLTQTVAAINALQPDAVVFTGDNVHNSLNEAQWAEFQRIIGGIGKGIRTLFVPGNHDIQTRKGSVDMTPYTTHLGADRFSIRLRGVRLTGINSDLLKNETVDPAREAAQREWLTQSLRKKRNNELSLVFAHHPFFLQTIDEQEGYSTLAPEKRRSYFELFKQCDVTAFFAGHLHDNAEASFNGIGMITASAVGRQLGAAQSGIRIITVIDGKLHHRYYPLDQLPKSRAEVIANAQ